PLLLASPASAIAYQIVLSAALRTVLEGSLDVQMVRLRGSELVVDVGIERAIVKSASIAVEDGWGVTGLVQRVVDLGPTRVDVGRLADRALRRALGRNLDLVSARAEVERSRSRTSVARFRFDLDAGDP